MSMLKTMKLVYKNMVVDRPKIGLYGLIALALICTTNLYFRSLELGQVTAGVMAALGLGAWFVVLPMVMTLIDIKNNPQRINKLLATIK